jgi:hypothetical protein
LSTPPPPRSATYFLNGPLEQEKNLDQFFSNFFIRGTLATTYCLKRHEVHKLAVP